MKDSLFEEFYEPEDIDFTGYENQLKSQQRQRERNKTQNLQNEVGAAPEITPEIYAMRERYKNDFVLLHEEVYPESTGVRPFGEVQKQSIHFGHHIFTKGGRLLKLEPRGYAKTTRVANEALAALLLGMQKYILIVCSNVTKAEEILDSIKTELYNNDKLLELFPGPVACFRHLDDTPQKAPYQTYNGRTTYIKYGSKGLRFPWVPDEESSGCFIEVRPLTNLKGLFHKVKAGPDAGKVYRPTLVIFDDPQTEDDARSESEVRKIISNIKRSALKGGSHSRKVSAIMAITPVCHGDVAYHFEKNEQSWEIVKYKMLEKFPDAHEEWMQEYSKIYLNYDRTVRGDRTRAALEARKYVEANWDRLHKGAVVSWDYAFGWEEDPQIEVSPVQHAYNIILDDGWEDFEYEYQCNTEYGEYEEGETMHAPPSQILTKILPLKVRTTGKHGRFVVPQYTKKIVTHMDVNKDFLTYLTVASGDPLLPHIIDYSTFPKQPGIFSKRNMANPLRKIYPEHPDYRDVLYLAVKDLIEYLSQISYIREDGVQLSNDAIGVDVRFEENYITRACKESPFRNIVVPCWGQYVGPDDDLLHEKSHGDMARVYKNAVDKPNRDNTVDFFTYDTNYFKTEVHKGWNLNIGIRGSLTVFEPDFIDQHVALADHCNAERPERTPGKKTIKTRITWKERVHQADNEFFDNLTGCFALLIREGIDTQLAPNPSPQEKKQDMQDFINQQKGRKLI